MSRGGPLPAEGAGPGPELTEAGPSTAADGSASPALAASAGQGAPARVEASAPEEALAGERAGPPSRDAKGAGSGTRGVQSGRQRVQLASKRPAQGLASKGDEPLKSRPPERVDDLF